MASSDDIGRRGEYICANLLTNFCGRNRPYFSPQFLGDKFAALDFLVEVIGAGESTPFFFVQVKTTRQAYHIDREGHRRLQVQVSRKDLRRMKRYPAPTYVIGIDEKQERGFIISANDDAPDTLSSLPTIHELNCETLEELSQEVAAYWQGRDMSLKHSVFSAEG